MILTKIRKKIGFNNKYDHMGYGSVNCGLKWTTCKCWVLLI